MLRVEEWQPTKFEPHRGGWRGSRDVHQVGPGSRLMADRIGAAYTRALRQHARGALLDVGCGHVPLYGCYRDLVSEVTCLDWPNTEHPSPHVDVYADLGRPLPLPADRYDSIVATDVLEHLPYPEVLWSEIHRLLRPGGKVIVGVPFMYWLHERPHDHLRYTEHRLRLFCADHDLTVLECEPYGGVMDVAADVLSKILDAVGLRAIPSLVAWLALRRKKVENRTPMPLGYVLVAQKLAGTLGMVEPVDSIT
jgi:SAM-dependent methyltransferase